MGRGVLFGLVMCTILLAAATTRSDVAEPAIDPPPDEEVAADDTVAAPLSDVEPQKDPFAPYRRRTARGDRAVRIARE
jgi:hypothetical protein